MRETLERILASRTFARSERARLLVRYLVEREQAGDAGLLKGFAIAVDVFGKDAGFDSSADAVVRVQAGRLRELLAQYFATEGANEDLRIVIPRGSYVPVYEAQSRQTEAAPAGAAAPVSEAAGPWRAQMMRQLHFFWAAMAVIIVMLGILIFRIAEPTLPAGGEMAALADAGSVASIAAPAPVELLPPVHIRVTSDAELAQRASSVLPTGLSGFDTVDFIDKDIAIGASPADPLQFMFQVSSGPAQGAIAIELQHVATGKVLLSRVLEAKVGQSEIDDVIADILSATAPASGTIYGHIEQSGPQSGLIGCLILNDDYYMAQTPERHEAAYRCFEGLADLDSKSPLVYAELAGLHLEAVTDRYPYPPNATTELALGFGHRAIQMGATSPSAHRAYGFLNSRIGNSPEAVRWVRKAYELNVYDLSMAAAYGYTLIFSGNYKDGAPIMEHAVDASSAHASWWDYGLFLAQFMLNDMKKAERATETLITAKRAHY
ncbi:MAG: hypothetical protein H0T56_00670, partial [Pseudaminobacter sp.]|nr:hypothetical protein [Pseudaminobacter sp.]